MRINLNLLAYRFVTCIYQPISEKTFAFRWRVAYGDWGGGGEVFGSGTVHEWEKKGIKDNGNKNFFFPKKN